MKQTFEQFEKTINREMEYLNREVSRDCYAETVEWMKKNGYAKKLRKQGIIDNKGRLLV